MALINLVDEAFVAAAPAAVAAALGLTDPASWRVWWPGLELQVIADRGAAGMRWAVTGAFRGSCEMWLEPVADGVVLHCYLRVDPAGAERRQAPGRPAAGTALGPAHSRRWAREARRRSLATKGALFKLKDQLEAGRRPGEAAAAAEPAPGPR